MKKVFGYFYAMALVCMTVGFTACDDNEDGADSDSKLKNEALQSAVTKYVDNTVVATYKNLADATIELSAACDKLAAAGGLTETNVKAACDLWKSSRKHWELSEAFLFGAAGDYNIDPHIDSWPLNQAELVALLKDPARMAKIKEDGGSYAGEFLGYGLLGFHAVEYVLFRSGTQRPLSDFKATGVDTEGELAFLVAVAEDLRNQCVRLEAAWAGADGVTAAKQQVLEDAELEVTFDYGYSMKNAGSAGSKYKTYLEACQELLDGCATIAEEVGNTKMGRPYNGATEDDRNYIESPYSYNSLADFVDNIISVRNAYSGSVSGDASVSDYIKKVAPEVDAKVKKAIEDAIAAIQACPAPFVNNTKASQVGVAVEACGTTLVKALEEAQNALLK